MRARWNHQSSFTRSFEISLHNNDLYQVLVKWLWRCFLMYFRYFDIISSFKRVRCLHRERETDTRKNGQTTDNRWTKNYTHKSHKTFIKQLDMSSCNMKIAIIVEKIITRVNGQCITCNSAIIVIFIHCLYLHLWYRFFQLRWMTVYFYFQSRR